ncbi:MAG TPA: glycogen synthase GlgA [Candidatus Omnitrophota bacterium]|jgi:starch synthase|nr:glycogen synthase GlgA [Candidatus Omnitrophota bacterium]
MSVVFCSSEVLPFAKTGGLADVCSALPLALAKAGEKVKIVLPLYRCVRQNGLLLESADAGFYRTRLKDKVDVYFVEHDAYFDRPGFYGDGHGDYPDNLKRFVFFNRQVFKLLKLLGEPIEVIHCHDWQTGAIPLLLKFEYARDRFFERTKSVFTIHNLAYQGLFPKEMFGELELGQDAMNDGGLYFYGKMSLLRSGIVCSDLVTTVSPQYAREIRTKELGCGMDDVLSMRGKGFLGILNGIDYSLWDPEHDTQIEQRYSFQNLKLKAKNKEALQNESGLANDRALPLFGFVGRLSHQKGIDLLKSAGDALCSRDMQMVFLGVGDEGSESAIRGLVSRYPDKVAAYFKFDEGLAHRIFAASDYFLMPSVFEPCGLTQLIALRYGTLPVVSAVGGLVDTVRDISRDSGTGIVFRNYDQQGFLNAVDRAIVLYHRPKELGEVQKRGMESHFSWDESAALYRRAYDSLRKNS